MESNIEVFINFINRISLDFKIHNEDELNFVNGVKNTLSESRSIVNVTIYSGTQYYKYNQNIHRYDFFKK